MSSASAPALESAAALSQIRAAWDASVLQTLKDYIAIPSQSPAFDAEWETNGHMDKAVELFLEWINTQEGTLKGMKVERMQEPGKTPILLLEVEGTDQTAETVLMYGHMDKQPPMTEHWMEGTGPHSPVVKDGKLYGRGGADDGYALFAALNALQVLQKQNIPHARAVILIENCEESGSRHLDYYIEKKKDVIGTPSLIVCLDSGCGNYEQAWMTTSLRGLLMFDVRVDILNEAVHSGMASGIVPSSFRILRQLLDRIEDPVTGKILVKEAYADPIPPEHVQYAKEVAETVGDTIHQKFPWCTSTCEPVSKDNTELVLGGTWHPTISYTGQDGLAPISNAGNVLRSHTTMRLSVRCPPSVEPKDVSVAFERELTRDAPYGAKVTYKLEKAQKGWQTPKLAPWLEQALQKGSQSFYDKPARFTGEGGSIPFMGMLGAMFPEAQFVITGVLGPSSNAHGPNEFLHIDMAQKLTGTIASVLADHYTATRK